MKSYFKILICTLAVFLSISSFSQELPLHQKRLSDRVLIVWFGDYMQTIATVALSTTKGIVVIETSLIHSLDAKIREVIEKEFGRNDFKYLINTHYHHDHTAGNQVYSDAVIVGHQTVPAGMRSELSGEGLVQLVNKFKGMLEEREGALDQMDPETDQYKFMQEFVILLKMAIRELQDGFIPTYPTLLFEKNMTLDMGDVTIHLFSFGGLHTDSDIVAFIPEEGLVAIGDLYPDQVLPYLRKERNWEMVEILDHWGQIVDSGKEIKYVNMAHSDMHISVESFKEQYRYFKAIWEGLRDLHNKGGTLDDAKYAFSIEKDFPYFKDRMLEIRGKNLHNNNVEVIWERIGSE